MKEELATKGFCKFEGAVGPEWIKSINSSLPEIFKVHENIRRTNNNPITSNGLSMNALIGNEVFFNFLQYLIDTKVIDWIEENFFGTKCILNSFTALSNIPGEDGVFHKKVHRDIRGFSDTVPLMLNMLVMLDDFTIENGATLLYSGTHLISDNDMSSEAFKNSLTHATGKAGDILIWNSNLLHASGTNTTDFERRALPITFSLPYYKQLLDYPRAIGYEKAEGFNEDLKRLLGYDSRVPASLDEWYSPVDQLMYKK